MYTSTNFKTKKELKAAVAEGRKISVFQPNDMFGGSNTPTNGSVTLEGPHYPKPHTWYAQATIVDGIITAVK
jgi:hypothetical protein